MPYENAKFISIRRGRNHICHAAVVPNGDHFTLARVMSDKGPVPEYHDLVRTRRFDTLRDVRVAILGRMRRLKFSEMKDTDVTELVSVNAVAVNKLIMDAELNYFTDIDDCDLDTLQIHYYLKTPKVLTAEIVCSSLDGLREYIIHETSIRKGWSWANVRKH